jgi:signal transduction histidine kinase
VNSASFTVIDETIESDIGAALQTVLEHAPSPFAVTKGQAHVLVYANRAFHQVFDATVSQEQPIADVLVPEAPPRMQILLDRALASGEVVRDRFLGSLRSQDVYWNCTIWPLCHKQGRPSGLIVELHKSPTRSPNRALQREVAERLLIAALHQAEVAEHAQSSLVQSEFLAETGRRLGTSLDTSVTRMAVAGISLPSLGNWCIVDLLERDGSLLRLAMIHPDPEKQLLLRELTQRWKPEPGDPFGLPAIQAGSARLLPVVIDGNVDAALETAAHSRENLRLLREMKIGTLLSVPMMSGNRLVGAVTFVSGQRVRAYAPDEIALAQKLAARSAEALESARAYDEALLLREQAELATKSKMRFLGNISHELRTPLNSIVAYIEVIAAEIHGPVTAAQRGDLERIRLSQQYLLTLVDELLTFVRAGIPRFNQIIEIPAPEAVARAVEMVGNALTRKSLKYERGPDDPDTVALGDAERVHQILVNLLGNAVKYTHRGGRIRTRCEAVGDQVLISVIDTGIGIPRSKFDSIFEPFVQVNPTHPVEGGVGLGLAISRELARTMQGDLTVHSELGKGTRFTLALPRVHIHSPANPMKE